jgi:hypothetical protein
MPQLYRADTTHERGLWHNCMAVRSMPTWILILVAIVGHLLSAYAYHGRGVGELRLLLAPLILRNNVGHGIIVMVGAILKIGSCVWLLLQWHWILAPVTFFLVAPLGGRFIIGLFSGGVSNLLYGGLAGLAGSAVCFGVGFLIVVTVGIPEGASSGAGVEPWNLPGTILGVAVWIAITVYALRKSKGRKNA